MEAKPGQRDRSFTSNSQAGRTEELEALFAKAPAESDVERSTAVGPAGRRNARAAWREAYLSAVDASGELAITGLIFGVAAAMVVGVFLVAILAPLWLFGYGLSTVTVAGAAGFTSAVVAFAISLFRKQHDMARRRERDRRRARGTEGAADPREW